MAQRRCPPPPTFATAADYGAHLSDADFWRPYAVEAVARHGFPAVGLTAGFAGTYPTLLAGDIVVKLFGYFGDWRGSFATECAANRVLARRPGIAPAVRASGDLYAGSESWPYLIVDRLRGTAWRDAGLSAGGRQRVAREVGDMLRRVHDIDVPAQEQLPRDWLAANGPGAADRAREWGILPEHLIDQIGDYIADYRTDQLCFLHADVTEDHIFVDADGLEEIIDWGDSMIGDPYYELGALHLGAFGGDTATLAAFLAGYGWPADPGFVRRAMQVALMHRFDLFRAYAEIAAGLATLADFAHALWTPGGRHS